MMVMLHVQVPLSRGDCNYTVSDAVGAHIPIATLPLARTTAALQALLTAVGAGEASNAANATHVVALQV